MSNNKEQLRIIILMLISLIRTKSLYKVALLHLGIDASPSDRAPDEYGCAESVSTLINKIDPTFPIVTGTWTLFDILEKSGKFKRVNVPMPGTIIISPTGMSSKGSEAPFVGHTGICGNRTVIMANDSYTGKWLAGYTLDTWRERWETKGGYPMYFYQFK